MPSVLDEAELYFDLVDERWNASPLLPLYIQRKQLLSTSVPFKSFLEARKVYWETHDEKFHIQYDPEERRKKRAQLTNTHKTALFFLQTCKKMMLELLDNSPCLMRKSFQNVLDLCSAPGGFCAALLERFENIKIEAHTLHPDNGGAPMITKHPRLRAFYNDVIELSCHESFQRLIRYDLIIGGGAWAGYVDETGSQEEQDCRIFYPNLKLKLAELHIMVQSIRPNGVAILKLPLKFENLTDTIVWIILEKIFKKVEPFRPSCSSSSSLWSHSFVYMICTGIRSEQIRQHFIQKLNEYVHMCIVMNPEFIKDFLSEEIILSEVLEKEEKVWTAMSRAYFRKLQELKLR